MTKKKQHKDPLIMKSEKQGYSLISNRQLFAMWAVIDYLAYSLAKEIHSTKAIVIDTVGAQADSCVANLSDEQIDDKVKEMTNGSK
jgi:hypothetical protein